MLPLPTPAYCICVPVGSQPQGRRTITPEGWPSKASRHLLARIYLELMAFGVERVRDWAPTLESAQWRSRRYQFL
ncbi:MAG: hypothetical protein RXR02_05425 [Thermoproteus sp.]